MDSHALLDAPVPPPLVCNLNAFDAAQGARYQAVTAALKAAVRSVEELQDGFAFTLPSDPDVCLAVMEFATLERLCCGFLTFRLELAPQGGPLTLSLSGPDGTKDVLGDFVEKMRSLAPPGA